MHVSNRSLAFGASICGGVVLTLASQVLPYSNECCDTGGGPNANCNDFDCVQAVQACNSDCMGVEGGWGQHCAELALQLCDVCTFPTAFCGDGMVNGCEACDDGNTVSSDGCLAICAVEPGYTCMGSAPSVCSPTCGDNLQVGGEQCDDGNTTPGDGCSATCQLEAVVTGNDACADRVDIFNGQTLFNSSGATADGPMADCGSPTGDVWFNYDATCTGPVTISASGYVMVLIVYDGCVCPQDFENQLACDEADNAAAGASVTFDALAGCCYKVRVAESVVNEDGFNGVLTVTPGPACMAGSCGNDIVECGEQCDDGANGNLCDGCNDSCQIIAVPTCNDNNACTTDSCNPATGGCVNTPISCDDLNFCTNDTCDPVSGCVNTVLNCNDGNDCTNDACNPQTGCFHSPVAFCGDEIVGCGEQCDDGNTTPGDGCSATCQFESNCCVEHDGNGCDDPACEADVCAVDPQCCSIGNWGPNCEIGANDLCEVCGNPPHCGDGSLDDYGLEGCDDGDSLPGDGCSPTCTVEPGWTCQGQPSNCSEVCGDMMVVGDEQCDDGNTNLCDACVNCLTVTPVICVPSDQCLTSVCDPVSGMCSESPVADGTSCNDENACTLSDSCQSGTCVGRNSVVCTPSDQCHEAGTCDPSTGLCSHPEAPDGTICADGNSCTYNDACSEGACMGAPPMCGNFILECGEDCDDGGSGLVGCDECDDNCMTIPPAVCGNGILECPEECDDGNASNCDDCTTDCLSQVPPVCDNGNFCDGVETCDPVTGMCQLGTSPCTNPKLPRCDEDVDACVECLTDDQCDDGVFCNGVETCVGNACTGGTSPCTTNQVCDEDADTCNAAVAMLDIELNGVYTPRLRCLTLTPRQGMCGDPMDVEVEFEDHDGDDVDHNGVLDGTEMAPVVATPVRGSVSVNLGPGWHHVCVKDPQHTLTTTADLTVVMGDHYTAALITLFGGDNDDDDDVDIHDLTYLMFHFGELAPGDSACPADPPPRDTDFSCSGDVGTDDFSILSDQWLQFSGCPCPLPAGQGSGFRGQGSGFDRRTRLPARELPAHVAARADLDRNGFVDAKDVEIFEFRHGLDGRLSARMK